MLVKSFFHPQYLPHVFHPMNPSLLIAPKVHNDIVSHIPRHQQLKCRLFSDLYKLYESVYFGFTASAHHLCEVINHYLSISHWFVVWISALAFWALLDELSVPRRFDLLDFPSTWFLHQSFLVGKMLHLLLSFWRYILKVSGEQNDTPLSGFVFHPVLACPSQEFSRVSSLFGQLSPSWIWSEWTKNSQLITEWQRLLRMQGYPSPPPHSHVVTQLDERWLTSVCGSRSHNKGVDALRARPKCRISRVTVAFCLTFSFFLKCSLHWRFGKCPTVPTSEAINQLESGIKPQTHKFPGVTWPPGNDHLTDSASKTR